MLDCSKVSAVIVTKGDKDLTPIIESLPFTDIFIWDNSAFQDRKIYGRYIGATLAKNDIIYVQDDDCLVGALSLLDHYEEDKLICNIPMDRRAEYEGTGLSLVGWGALFHRKLIHSFHKYWDKFPIDELFLRECDRVFTALNQFRQVNVGMQHLPYAFGLDRMGKEKRHRQDFIEIRRRIALVKESV